MIAVGSRVEIPAHLDQWMQGKRFGYVARIGGARDQSTVALVALDKGGTVRVTVDLLREVGGE